MTGPQSRSMEKYFYPGLKPRLHQATRNRFPAKIEDVDACKVSNILMIRDLKREWVHAKNHRAWHDTTGYMR